MFKNLEKDLYPTGRALKCAVGSNKEKIHESIHLLFEGLEDSIKTFINSLFPDNDTITNQELSFLEFIYGVYYKDNVSDNIRKERILDKIKYTKPHVYRQSLIYIQEVLNQRGFDVTIVDNLNEIPSEAINNNNIQHSLNVLHGETTQHGKIGINVIANNLDINETILISELDQNKPFYIYIETPIASDRLVEFRELVLRIKPAHLVAVIIQGNLPVNGDFNNDFNNDFLT